MNRFWISWHQPTEDWRSINFPPIGVMGYWCSGYRGEDDVPILVALVDAESEDDAKAVVLKDWPEATDWRFVKKRTQDYRTGDRFPLPDWSPLLIGNEEEPGRPKQ